MGQFVGVALQIIEEAFEFSLHRVHLLAHVENDFYAREIHTKIARQGKNEFEPFKIRISVETRVAFRARRLQQTFAFIEAQRLRMKVELFRDGTDRECLGSLSHAVFSFEFSVLSGLEIFAKSVYLKLKTENSK